MLDRKTKIAIIGQGYVGLPITLLLSKSNYSVCAYDIDKKLIAKLKNGSYVELNKNEDDVIDLYKSQIKKKKISFSSNLEASDIYVICVPTPISRKNKPDLSFVYSAIKEVIKYIKDGDLIIIESTIALGSIKEIKKFIKSKKKLIKYQLAYCPERVLPGNSLKEVISNERIIGGIDKKSEQISKEFYQIFVKGKIHITSIEVAEVTKLAENSFRDVNIAYANELSMICSKNNVDPQKVIHFANKHPRVNILTPGIGVGGHCIPIDPWFLIENYKKKFSIIKNARMVNKEKTRSVSKKIIDIVELSIKNKKKRKNNIFLLGLSYKANIGDFRESPSIEIINHLSKKLNKNIDIYINDPYLSNLEIKNTRTCSIKNGLKKSKIVVILVAHNQYKNIKRYINSSHIILDECNILEKKN